MEPIWLFDDSPAMEGATSNAKRTLKELKRDIKAERKLMLDCDKKGNYDEALYHAGECLRCSQEALTYVNTLHSSTPMKIWIALVEFILGGALRAAAWTAVSAIPTTAYGYWLVNNHPSDDDAKQIAGLVYGWATEVAPRAIGGAYLVSGIKAGKYKLAGMLKSLIGKGETPATFSDKNGNNVINACRHDIMSMVDEYQNCVDAYRMRAENRWRFN